jgi:hypothetical protein
MYEYKTMLIQTILKHCGYDSKRTGLKSQAIEMLA